MSIHETSSDTKTLLPKDIVRSFGTSAPANSVQINSTYTGRGAMGTLYCSGNAYIFGSVGSPLRYTKSSFANDGTVLDPGITFQDDGDTGFYRVSSGLIGVTSNGVEIMIIGGGNVQIDGVITTGSGDLVINPVGDVDFSGNTLIDVGGISLSIGSPNDVLIIDGAGLVSSEAQLSPLRGGTGEDSTSSTGVAKVAAGTWSFSQIVAADISALTTLTSAEIIVDTINSTGDITFTPAGGDVYFDDLTIHQTPADIVGGDVITYTANVLSTTNSAVVLLSIPTSSSTNGTIYTVRALVSLADITGGANTGSYSFLFNGKNLLGVVTVSTLVQQASILDGGLNATNMTVDVSGTTIRVLATGLGATNINWAGCFEVVVQQF